MATKSARPKSQLRSELLLENKIQKCQQRISEGQQTIEAIRSQQNGMCASDIIGISVEHKLFGTGIITEQNAASITVSFASGSKRFVMPSAFLDGFLKTEDTPLNERLLEYLSMQQKIQDVMDDISASNRAIFALEAKKYPHSR